MAGSVPFLFIVATAPSGFKRASTQQLVRKHASKTARKARTANFVLHRHNPRQLPVDIAQFQCQEDQGTASGRRTTVPQHTLTESHLDEMPNSNAHVQDIGCLRGGPCSTDSMGAAPQILPTRQNTPSICQLGSNSSVLDHIFPVHLDLSTQSLLHRCK